jgi:hypothetical protein
MLPGGAFFGSDRRGLAVRATRCAKAQYDVPQIVMRRLERLPRLGY